MILVGIFIGLTVLSVIFFREQLRPFAVYSDLSELERESVNFFDILVNNIFVCAVAISGLYFFGISAFLVYIVNPIVLGFILASNWVSTGEIFYFVNMLIPHSIFEIPAIVMSCSLGLKGKRGREALNKRTFSNNVGVILVLLIIAAAVESTVSASLM